MSNENGSTPERDLPGPRESELAQASIALTTAYDRLQDLRASLRSFTAQRDRLSGIRRTQQQERRQDDESMRPTHSAIVLSDSEDESEVDIEALRESFPSRLLELTSRWGSQHHLHPAADSRPSSSPHSHTALLYNDPRLVYPPPPLRRRRPPPPAVPSSRDGIVLSPSNSPSSARRSILEAHMRQLRRASSPSESSTTLGRRVAQRAAAQAAISERQAADTPDSIIRSTLPLGLEPRAPNSPRSFGSTYPHSLEPRAATHLRHSILPIPPSSIRLSPRAANTNNSHARFGDRLEVRARTTRSNSLTTGTSPLPIAAQDNHADPSTHAAPLASRLGQPRASNFWGELVPRYDRLQTDSGVARHPQSQEQVVNMNWSELMSEGDRDGGDLSDPAAWMRPPRGQVPGSGSRSVTAQAETDTDDTIHDSPPDSSRNSRATGQEGGVRRRRGWARLDPDGDEISTEDEASLERIRTELRLPRPRNWGRSGTAWAAGRGSQVAVLDFVHHNSRDTAIGHRDVTLDDVQCDDDMTRSQDVKHSHHILDGLFHSEDSAYINPLPVRLPDKGTPARGSQHPKEVSVTLDHQLAGR
ncbi:hypothetical protein JB92DRAFT_3017863 [Gautieria morchelliformis]|nr:hypothetical protein JB92DRAFT_3017863 [Gautieria morchelliformis]